MFPWFREIVTGVPAHERYLHLDELERSTHRLAPEHPEMEVSSSGAFRAGRRMRCLETPGGPLQALVVALPHLEEPVGALALESLLPLLADGPAQELGSGCSVVKAGDPDAALCDPVRCQVASLPCALLATRDRYRPERPGLSRPRTAR